MNFLIDENIERAIVRYLEGKGHTCLIINGDMCGREDYQLVHKAHDESRVIITNDKDFGLLVYRDKLPCYGNILFRFILENPAQKIMALETVLRLGTDKIINHFIVISERKIRIRRIT